MIEGCDENWVSSQLDEHSSGCREVHSAIHNAAQNGFTAENADAEGVNERIGRRGSTGEARQLS